MLFHLTALAVAAWAIVRGFRKGLARQTPAVIGTAFGIVSAHLLSDALDPILLGALPTIHGHAEQTFTCDTIASAIVFFAVYAVFRVVTGFLGSVLHRSDRTILDNIAGAGFLLFKWLLYLSIAFNMIVALNLNATLLRAAKSDDGNISLEVMLLAPALLGGENVEDLALQLQLQDAKKIS